MFPGNWRYTKDRHSKGASSALTQYTSRDKKKIAAIFPHWVHLYPSPHLSARTGWEIRCSPVSWVTCVRTLGPKSRKTLQCGREKKLKTDNCGCRNNFSTLFPTRVDGKSRTGVFPEMLLAQWYNSRRRENPAESVLTPGLFKCETLDYWAQTAVT